MNENSTTRPSRRLLTPRRAVAAVGVVAVAGAGLALGTSVAGADDPTDQYGTNQAGLTYGSLFDSTSPDHEPDLIRVLATNGREGYAYQRDLNPPELEPANPEEAGELQDARDQKAAAAFVDALADELNTRLATTPDDAVDAYRAAVDASHARSDNRVQDTLATTLTALGADEDDAQQTAAIDDALQAAAEAVQREIPVYESDGTTQIGVFISG
ncbi:hypothetical protein [Cellulomonas oligotrophica]|uniref:Uncharacterized protein n=1 Tax=Cellulomonas oligotrophica TaxID=931536 RepID=A0A7Y9FCD0_9CELL|nr:hypothetical protein [Cellulomonas oligotrophica]NYD84731.1 hypothetical protein [Cellulomonas oligotrophica]GIG31798.1 hypothetical protein Col01nite_09570 [Cellulomonas oligotrophica]